MSTPDFIRLEKQTVYFVGIVATQLVEQYSCQRHSVEQSSGAKGIGNKSIQLHQTLRNHFNIGIYLPLAFFKMFVK